MRNRSARGLTILQTLISAALLVIVLAGANAMVSAGTNVAQSTTNLGTASNRADHSLSAIADALRRGSLASVRLLNDTAFTDGSSDTGFKIRTVQTFTGTPVDVTVYNAYGYIADAAGNWVVALEKNATSWQIAAFDQNGKLIARYPTPISGNPIEIDNDITNHKLHVWYDASGTLKYVIFIYT